MQLNSYVKTVTNKRLLIFESRDDLNRCISYKGKPDQHDTTASHSSPRMPGVRFLWAVPIRGNLSRVINRFGRIPLLLRKMASDTIHSTAADRSGGSVPSFSPKQINESVDLSQTTVDDKLLGLLSSYHQHAIDTFNTCSRGPTHRYLTDTCGGYNLRGAGFSHRADGLGGRPALGRLPRRPPPRPAPSLPQHRRRRQRRARVPDLLLRRRGRAGGRERQERHEGPRRRRGRSLSSSSCFEGARHRLRGDPERHVPRPLHLQRRPGCTRRGHHARACASPRRRGRRRRPVTTSRRRTASDSGEPRPSVLLVKW
jgi:hypothetical protein